MANARLCFDKFVISTENLKKLHKKINLNQVPSCENKRNGVVMSKESRREFDAPIGSKIDRSLKYNLNNNCVNENLKCNSGTQNIIDDKDLFFYLDEKTEINDTRERKNYSDLILDLQGFFSIINDTDSINKWNSKKSEEKDEWNNGLRHLLREILSLENDNELIDKKLQQLYNTSTTTGKLYSKFINEFQKENIKSEDLGENEGEHLMRRDESYRSSKLIGYNNLFYSILVIVSALFLKSQLK